MAHIERLELMQKMLEEVIAGSWKQTGRSDIFFGTQNIFDLGCWVSFDRAAKSGVTCGFSACAVGHACMDKRFTSQGLRIEHGEPLFKVTRGQLLGRGWNAVSEFFEIERSHAMGLFSPDSYIDGEETTAEQVLDRVKRFLEKAIKSKKGNQS